jgi:hypothetical protein
MKSLPALRQPSSQVAVPADFSAASTKTPPRFSELNFFGDHHV